MVDTAKLKADLMRDEGFRGRPYLCSAGKNTIGYGHNLDAAPMPQEIGEAWLQIDMRKVLIACDTFPWFRKQSEARQRVIANMVYQMGLEGVRDFRKMIAAIEKGNYEEAARQMEDSKWAKSDSPSRAHRLIQQMRVG